MKALKEILKIWNAIGLAMRSENWGKAQKLCNKLDEYEKLHPIAYRVATTLYLL